MPKRARTMQTHKFEQEFVQKYLVKMIISNELPFLVVEHDEFKQLMEATFPGFHVPSCEMISKDCVQLFVDEKLKLKSFIKSTNPRVCLSLDIWTSNQSVRYLCITAHFIDEDWNLHKKIIGFSPVCSDNGEEIGRLVESCLLDWEISNVLTISTGNASSYNAAVSYLKTRLPNTVSDNRFLHLKCLVNFINSMVKEVLNESDKSITRVREAVRYVTQSTTRIEEFKECAKQYGITSKYIFSLDCPSSWNSTFEMLQMSATFEGVFGRFKINNTAYKRELQETCGVPDRYDWERVRKVLNVLKGLYQSTESISQWRVQSNMFLFELAELESHLDNSGARVCGWGFGFDTKAINVALELKWKYNEYWGDVENSNVLIYVANILDPRRKVELIEFYFRHYFKHDYTKEGVCMWKKKAEWVVSATYDLFNEYIGKTGASQESASFQTSGYMRYLYDDDTRGKVGFGDNVRNKTEIDIYLSELCERDNDFFGFDILLWWKNNSAKFPILSKMAKDVLAVPISAVALESAFNIGGSLLDDFQSSLSPSMAEALVCTQDWLRESIKVVKVKEDSPNFDKFVKDIYEHVEYATSG